MSDGGSGDSLALDNAIKASDQAIKEAKARVEILQQLLLADEQRIKNEVRATRLAWLKAAIAESNRAIIDARRQAKNAVDRLTKLRTSLGQITSLFNDQFTSAAAIRAGWRAVDWLIDQCGPRAIDVTGLPAAPDALTGAAWVYPNNKKPVDDPPQVATFGALRGFAMQKGVAPRSGSAADKLLRAAIAALETPLAEAVTAAEAEEAAKFQQLQDARKASWDAMVATAPENA